MPTTKTKRERLERYLANTDDERLEAYVRYLAKTGAKSWKQELLRVELIRRRLLR